MSVLTINELKARFAAGDKPSAKDFSDFIDTVQGLITAAVSPVSPGTAFLFANGFLSGSTYSATYSPGVLSYLDGTYLAFKADITNPGGGTNFNAGVGSHPIVRERGTPLKAGDILAGQIVEVRYDLSNTRWIMQSPTSHPGLRSGDIIPSAFALDEDGTRFLCNGQSVDTNVYPTLTPLSTTYGTPSPNDGHHVKLPDYRARFPLGVGTLPSAAVVNLGDTGGEEKHLLTSGESGVPAHDHPFTIPGDAATDSQNSMAIQGDGSLPQAFTTGNNTPANAADAHNTMPPWIAAYYYILT